MFQSRALVLLLFGAVLLAGCRPAEAPFECTDAIGCVDIAPGEPIKIGVLQNLGGGIGPSGLAMLHSVQLALDDRGYELLGQPIELRSEDSQCSGEGGTTAALKVAADPQIVGIVGPTCSGAAASAMKILTEAGLVMISGTSSSPSLTSVGAEPGSAWQPGFFRTAQNDALAGQAAATFAFEHLGVTRAATINDGDPYTRGLTDTFAQAFAELGAEVVLDAAVNKGDTDMGPVLDAVAASGVEMVFFPMFQPEGEYVVLQAKDMQALENVSLMSAEGLYFDSFIEAVGEAGVGMHLIVPTTPEGPTYDAFLSRLETVSSEPAVATPYMAHSYDAANLLLNAIEAVAVRSEDGTLHIGRQALRDALHATSGYQGLTGSLTCDEYGDCGVARFQIVRLDDPAAGLDGLAANVVYTYPAEQ